MKFEIETVNDNHFKNIATLVDKPDYIKAVNKLRAKWKIIDRFKSKNYKGFYVFICGENGDEKLWSEFLNEVANLRSMFNKSPNFDKVIIYSIAFDKIPSHAYKSCYIKAEPLSPSGENGDDHQFSIVFSPETTRDEISEEFAKFKNGLSGKLSDGIKEILLTEGYDWDVFPTKQIKDHTAGNIKRDREWYWLKENGLSYKQILEIAGIGKTERDSIVQAIKGYRKRLAK
jgi:hypothetical protein